MQDLKKRCPTHSLFTTHLFTNFIFNLSLSPALEFERYDATRRLRLVLSELLAIMGHLQKGKKKELVMSQDRKTNII